MTMFMCLLLFLFRSDRVPVRARRGLNTSVQRGAWPTSCSRIMRRMTSIIPVAPMRRVSGVKICCACKRMSDPSNSTATVTVAWKRSFVNRFAERHPGTEQLRRNLLPARRLEVEVPTRCASSSALLPRRRRRIRHTCFSSAGNHHPVPWARSRDARLWTWHAHKLPVIMQGPTNPIEQP